MKTSILCLSNQLDSISSDSYQLAYRSNFGKHSSYRLSNFQIDPHSLYFFYITRFNLTRKSCEILQYNMYRSAALTFCFL